MCKTNTLHGVLTVIGGVLIHFTYGHFYTAGNMGPYIMSYMKIRVDNEIDMGNAIWISAVALAMQGVSVCLGGVLANKIGFRPTLIISSLLMSGGTLLTYFSINYNLVSVIMTNAVMIGLGMGLGYSVAMAIASSWFPARRGLVVGFIVAGFGLGSLVFTPIQTAFINPNNTKVNETTRLFDDPAVLDRVPTALLMLGGLIFSLEAIGCIIMREKPVLETQLDVTNASSDESRKLIDLVTPCGEMRTPIKIGEDDSVAIRKRRNDVEAKTLNKKEINVEPKAVLCRLEFYMLWFIMLCNIIPLTIIASLYKIYGQTFIDNDQFLSGVATASALCNSGGRIMWGSITDKISFKFPLCVMHLIWGLLLLTFPLVSQIENSMAQRIVYLIFVLALFLALSGMFTIMPAATSTLFGPKNMAINYGMVFSAFTIGSILGAVASTFIFPKGSYGIQMQAAGVVCLIAFCIDIWFEDLKAPACLNLCRVCSNICWSGRRKRQAQQQDYQLANKGDEPNSV